MRSIYFFVYCLDSPANGRFKGMRDEGLRGIKDKKSDQGQKLMTVYPLLFSRSSTNTKSDSENLLLNYKFRTGLKPSAFYPLPSAFTQLLNSVSQQDLV